MGRLLRMILVGALTASCSAPAKQGPPAAPNANWDSRNDGGVTRREVYEVIRDHSDEVQGCFMQGMERNRKLAGRVDLRFAVAADGGVERVEVAGNTLPDEWVVHCLIAVAKTWRFSRPADAPAQFSFPFVFKSE